MIITEELLEKTLGECNTLGCDVILWRELSPRARKQLMDQAVSYHNLMGRVFLPLKYCVKCCKDNERQESRNKIKGQCNKLRHDLFFLPPNIEDYGNPWKEAVSNNPDIWQEAKQWQPSLGGFFLYGPGDIGKTALARFLMLQAIRKGYTATEYKCVLFEQHEDSRFNPEKLKAMYNAACNAAVLILDDISAPKYSKWSLDRLWWLADARAERGLPTIITSNISPADLYEHRLLPADPENSQLARGLLKRFKPMLEVKMAGISLRDLTEYTPATKGATKIMEDKKNANG